jgi:cytochrome c biogenesis protein CcdA
VSVLTYSLLRLLLLVACGGLIYALGLRGPVLLIVAFVASGVLSFFVLRDSRVRAGASITRVFGRLNDRIDEAARAEDDRTGHTPE